MRLDRKERLLSLCMLVCLIRTDDKREIGEKVGMNTHRGEISQS